MVCPTGDCGGKSIECNGREGKPPFTFAEFNLNKKGSKGFDHYTVSLANGYNLPMIIIPNEKTFENTIDVDCSIGGGCVENLSSELCPETLRKYDTGGQVTGCFSPCIALKTDQACCKGKFNTSETCAPDMDSILFKRACPGCYSFPLDFSTISYTCRGNDRPSAEYTVQFC